MTRNRFAAVAFLFLVCGCSSESLPELRTSYDGSGAYAVRSNTEAHTAVLGADRFVIHPHVIKKNGAILTRYSAGTKELHIKKSKEGHVEVFADGTQLIPAGKTESDAG